MKNKAKQTVKVPQVVRVVNSSTYKRPHTEGYRLACTNNMRSS